MIAQAVDNAAHAHASLASPPRWRRYEGRDKDGL
jgi:hypothetical protein